MSSSATTEEPPADGGPAAAGTADAAPSPRRPRPVFLVVGLVLAGALAVVLFVGIGTGPGKSAVGAGSLVPAFSLHEVGTADRTVSVPADGGGAGRPAILLFFASWCGPCKQEVPALAAAYNRQHATKSRLNEVRVVGVDGLDPDAASFVRSDHVTFPVGTDRTETVTHLFPFVGPPGAVFVRADGTIAKLHYGALSAATFVTWEKRLLAT